MTSPDSGVASTAPMLGHSMGILRLYEILRKDVEGRRSGTCSVSVRGELMRLEFHDCLAPDLRSTTMLSAPIIHKRTCAGGAQPPVARARAPVCPSLATPLSPELSDKSMCILER